VQTDQIAGLLRPWISLEMNQLVQVRTYIGLLLRWNSRINLTAIRDEENIVKRHFGESFFSAARLLEDDGEEKEPSSILDLGSGAGFPGIPIAMLAQRSRVTLIEAHAKKSAFLNEVIRSLNLSQVSVFTGRGENYSGKAQLVTMRAVEKFDTSMPLAASMVEPGGRLAIMIGAGQIDEAKESGQRFHWRNPIEVPGGHSRVLLVGTAE
jgi:16S rRNA (guanine527-N7)-methyltransferase